MKPRLMATDDNGNQLRVIVPWSLAWKLIAAAVLFVGSLWYAQLRLQWDMRANTMAISEVAEALKETASAVREMGQRVDKLEWERDRHNEASK